MNMNTPKVGAIAEAKKKMNTLILQVDEICMICGFFMVENWEDPGDGGPGIETICKTKRAPKVEVGTATTDASMDEWLQGTSYSSQGSKSKKKK
ncbi:hypothetical protein Leryth_011533 [Lithospermum erythrorhizon]|nr:hypothetical protein Leryth_011533 [Lithospermum erythrorhizon]